MTVTVDLSTATERKASSRFSAIKSPDRELPSKDRLAFGALSKFLTGARGLGYYREYVAGDRRDALGGVPRLEE